MDLGFIFLAIALIGLVIFVVAQPFLERSRHVERAADDPLVVERESILVALRDLDFDHATGKVADEDYGPQRAALMARGAAVLKQLDVAGVVDEASAIEQAIAARRKTAASAPARVAQPKPADGVACPGCGAPVQAGDRFCSGCGMSLNRTCAQCGTAVTAGDRFCGKCGAPVALEAQSS